MIHRFLSLLISGRQAILCTALCSLLFCFFYFSTNSETVREVTSTDTDHVHYLTLQLRYLLTILANWSIMQVIATFSFLLNKKFRIIKDPTKLPFILLVLFVTTIFLPNLQIGDSLAAFCMILLFFPLLNGYKKTKPIGSLFNVALCFSLATIAKPVSVLLFPALLWGFYLFRLLSFKSFLAFLWGLLPFYWLLLGYCIVQNDYSYFFNWKSAFNITYYLPTAWKWKAWLLCIVWLLSLTMVFVNMQTHSYGDKIRSRLFLRFSYSLLLAETLVLFFFANEHTYCLYLFSISASLLLSHYFTLVRSKYATILFYTLFFVCILFFFIRLYL